MQGSYNVCSLHFLPEINVYLSVEEAHGGVSIVGVIASGPRINTQGKGSLLGI